MSGGPTIDGDGLVVGVNVSSAGNQLSFLVPAERVANLLAEYLDGQQDDTELLTIVARQFKALHEDLLGALLAQDLPTIRLGPFLVPTGTEGYFDCWAGSVESDDDLYRGTEHYCAPSDQLLVTQDLALSPISLAHVMIESEALGSLRFYTLYSQFFQDLEDRFFDETDETTDYACEQGNVRTAAAQLRVTFCARANTQLSELHDVFVRTAVLGDSHTGVVSTLSLAGVPLPLARRLVASYLEAFRWAG